MQKTKAPNFSIVIPNYNGKKFLDECLSSLHKAINKCPESKFEIILVDNGSKDESVDIFNKFSQKFSSSQLTTNCHLLNTNHGFAGGVNFGIEKAKYDWVVLLNNDLTMELNWFELISQAICANTDPKTVVFTGTVLSKDGSKFESQGLEYNIIGKCSNISNGLSFQESSIKNLESFFIWGASAAFTVYRKSVLQKIGLFDSDFFAYEEDVDLALRLHKLGYKTLYIPQALSYHLGGGTSGRMGNFRSRHDFKNWIYIIIKNYNREEIFSHLPQIITERLRNLSGLIKNTILAYSWKSVYILPRDLILTITQILFTLPLMFQKRRHFFNLLQLTK